MVNVRVGRSVSIELVHRLAHHFDMPGRVPLLKRLNRGSHRERPMPVRMPFTQKRCGPENPLRSLWMSRCRVFCAAHVVINDHVWLGGYRGRHTNAAVCAGTEILNLLSCTSTMLPLSASM